MIDVDRVAEAESERHVEVERGEVDDRDRARQLFYPLPREIGAHRAPQVPGKAAPAVLLAKSDFDGAQRDWKPFLEKNAGKEIILYCRSGNRSGKVAAALAAPWLLPWDPAVQD